MQESESFLLFTERCGLSMNLVHKLCYMQVLEENQNFGKTLTCTKILLWSKRKIDKAFFTEKSSNRYYIKYRIQMQKILAHSLNIIYVIHNWRSIVTGSCNWLKIYENYFCIKFLI